MTRLEQKKRRHSARKSLLSPGAKTNPILMKPKLKKGRWTAKAKITLNDRPEVGPRTEQAIMVEVKDLLKDRGGSCTVEELARQLSTSNKVRNAYANEAKVGGSRQLSGHMIRKFCCDLREMTFGLKRRYELTNAFANVHRQKNALNIVVDSWTHAKEFLSSEIEFVGSDIEFGRHDYAINHENYATPIRATFPAFTQYDEHITSEEKWRGIAATSLPAKIAEQANEGKYALERESQVKYAEHEEAEKQRRRELDLERLEQRQAEKEKEEEAKEMASSLLRDFTEDEEAIVDSAIFGRGSPNQVMKSEGPDSVQRASMQKLQPGQWLNDEVIHYFYVMLGKRDEELCRADPNRKRSHFFKSFFITKLLNEGHTDPGKDGTYEYRNVKRWSKKVPGKDIFNLDKVFFPINEGRMHWVCAVAFMQEKRIQFYDSMGADGHHYLEHVFRYIQDEHQDKKKSPLPDKDEWRLIECTADTPRQGNGFDCGVFTCMFADFLSKDCPLLFTQEHVNQCRKRIALSIMQGKAIL